MTLQNIITLERLGYYDSKIKQWVKNLTVVAPDVANSITGNDGLMTKEDKAKLDGIASGA
jgi:roadblock/LC7 domain-containing protein